MCYNLYYESIMFPLAALLFAPEAPFHYPLLVSPSLSWEFGGGGAFEFMAPLAVGQGPGTCEGQTRYLHASADAMGSYLKMFLGFHSRKNPNRFKTITRELDSELVAHSWSLIQNERDKRSLTRRNWSLIRTTGRWFGAFCLLFCVPCFRRLGHSPRDIKYTFACKWNANKWNVFLTNWLLRHTRQGTKCLWLRGEWDSHAKWCVPGRTPVSVTSVQHLLPAETRQPIDLACIQLPLVASALAILESGNRWQSIPVYSGPGPQLWDTFSLESAKCHLLSPSGLDQNCKCSARLQNIDQESNVEAFSCWAAG